MGDVTESTDQQKKNMPRCLAGLKRIVGLNHEQPRDFVTLQFTRNPKWCIVYRLVLAFYVTTSLGACALTTGYANKVYIYLTYWSYTVLALCQIVSLINTCTYTNSRGSDIVLYHPDVLPGKFRFQWILFNISSAAAFVVTAMFWTVVYDGKGVKYCSFNLHAINLMIVVADVFVTAMPVCYRHVIFTMMYGVIYSLFAIIYWFSGGTNHKGDPYIYSVLDFSKDPMKAFLYLFAASFVAPVFTHGIVWILYKLRQICANFSQRVSRSQDV